jgi:hypothetical protein
MTSSLQYGAEFFGIFFRTTTFEINQFAFGNTDRSRIKFKCLRIVDLGFSRGGGIFNLKTKKI